MIIYITWFIIVALVGLIVGFISGTFFGAHLICGHFLQMGLIPQRRTFSQTRPQARRLRRAENHY